jgi:hypothetical protein
MIAFWGRTGIDRVCVGNGGVSRMPVGLVNHLASTISANNTFALAA